VYVAATPPSGHGSTYSQGRFYELVRFEGWAAPGDLLVLMRTGANRGGAAEHMLQRSGPRGGLVDAWPEPAMMVDPWGIHVGPDGTLCIAERGARQVLLQRQVLPGTPYTTVATYPGVGDVTDCHLADNGTLYALVADPPSILRLSPGGYELEATVDPTSHPIDLIETPAGKFEVLDANGAARGYAWLADGRKIEMFKSGFEVRADGHVVARLPNLINVIWGQPVVSGAETQVHLVPRPDGLVVAIPFSRLQPQSIVHGLPWVFDPESGDAYLLSGRKLLPDRGVGVALIPGGSADDPWGMAPDEAASGGPPGPNPPEVPQGPPRGVGHFEEVSCAVRAAPATSPWLGWLWRR